MSWSRIPTKSLSAVLNSPLRRPKSRVVTQCKRQVSYSVVYSENGDPNKVLQLSTGNDDVMTSIKPTQVAIEMLAAPINPADINMIQGVYPVRPPTPAIGGNEGVGRVIATGNQVAPEDFSAGDWVVLGESGWGTWRTHATANAADLIKVPNDIPAISAATIGVNACTAYRMLKDFVRLEPGDVVIQNGANSGVGQAVIQIAAAAGIQTINIVRQRDNLDVLVDALKDLGATYVITDEFVRKPDMKDFMRSVPKAKLALNCVSGKSAAELMKHLAKKATMVTYGGMSKQPLMVPAGPLIFSDIALRGYWMTEWNKEHQSDPARGKMWDDLCAMVRAGTFVPPLCDKVPLVDFKSAVEKSMEPFVSRKQILIMDDSLL